MGIYKGRGMHSVSGLEDIIAILEEECHQKQIRLQQQSQRIQELEGTLRDSNEMIEHLKVSRDPDYDEIEAQIEKNYQILNKTEKE